jgi:predicted aminopeptidase
VGEFPYLGFFKKSNGLRKKAELEDAGFDVYLRRAGAYSMLGIVADPIYSPLLRLRDADLANLIIHELTHATIWVQGNVEFNENIAVFIGNQGALEYCRDRLGKDSEARYILASNEDDRIFSIYLNELYGELEALYERPDLSDQEKLKAKAEVFAKSREKFKEEVLPGMSSGRYRGFLELELNNAVVTSRKVYYKDLSMYREIFEHLGSDLSRMVEFLKDVEKRGGDSEAYCREWLQANPEGLDD